MHAWEKSDGRGGIKLYRIVSLVSLLIAVLALFLALRKPQPVAPPQTPAAIAANAQSFQNKVGQLQQAQTQGQSGTEVHLTADEITAAIAQASGAVSAPQPAPASTPQAQGSASSSGGAASDLSAAIASGSAEQALAGEPVISFEGDVMHGQFVTEIGGKKVYVTVSGRLGAKDGYATFEPTEFKVGDIDVPVALVKDELQKKMLEQRDRLKLPEFVSDVRVENGELVVKQK
jgi:hypothetical protein